MTTDDTKKRTSDTTQNK